MPDTRATAADAFDIRTWTPEAEEAFQRQFQAECAADGVGCYFCGSPHHRLTECSEKP